MQCSLTRLIHVAESRRIVRMLFLVGVVLTSASVCAQHVKFPMDSVEFVKKFPTVRLIDSGKLDLYCVTGVEPPDEEEPALFKTMAALADDPTYAHAFYVGRAGKIERKTDWRSVKKVIRDWFADDPALQQYILTEKLGAEFMPYLVRMYNHHAPRPFEDKAMVPVFIEKGFTDTRDGQRYDVITMNNVTWLSENLRYCSKHHDALACAEDHSEGVYYTWDDATVACPPGWQLPDETEWKTMFLGMGVPLQSINKQKFDEEGTLGKSMLRQEDGGFNAIQQEGAARFWVFTEFSKRHAFVVAIAQDNNNRVDPTHLVRKDSKAGVRCVKK